MSIPNVSGRFSRVLLLGGTSEIGLAILSSLKLDPGAEVILAGRDPQRLEAAGKSLSRAGTPPTPSRSPAMTRWRPEPTRRSPRRSAPAECPTW